MSFCRICARPLFHDPLLTLKNMPAMAQYLPTREQLPGDGGIDLVLGQCSECGLVQLTNDPVPYYREVIRASAYSPEMKEFRLAQFAAWSDQFGLAGKKVLEVGCGCGEYLELMKAVGTDAYGMEFGAESVEVCRQRGLTVEKGYFETGDERLVKGPFDAFFILNWLEHLPNIPAVLDGVKRNLKPGGVGLVEVPNFSMVLEKRLFTEFTSDHLYYFTVESLKTTLESLGFDVLDCREVWHDYIISAQVKKREPLDLQMFVSMQERLRRELHDFIECSGKTAIWGAGHQALTVMALGGLAGKVEYVVDSAPFKQGRFTAVSQFLIVPPERLDQEPPEAIIVMAAAYSDEVVALIRRRYGNRFRLAVLREKGLEIIP